MTKSVDEKYVQLSDIDHVLLNGGMYIGETSLSSNKLWVYNSETEKFENQEIEYSPGFLKIVDEILVNSYDHYINSSKTKYPVETIKVSVDDESITVMNDGRGIEIEIHKATGVYVPELIFGRLKTSSNYDKTEAKITGGKHGLGAKLTAIYSKKFVVETVYGNKKYKQVFEDNLKKIGKPKITELDDKKSGPEHEYTKITFYPDLIRFGYVDKIPDTMKRLVEKRANEISACTDKSVAVSFNGKKVSAKDFVKYCELFVGDRKLIHEVFNDRWEIAVAQNDGFEQISFVNGIQTIKGGKHVDYILDQIVDKLTEQIKKKKKDAIIKPSLIKNNLFLFIRSSIENPNFDSQTKENMTTPKNKFGSTCEISDAFIKKLMKTEIYDKILNNLEESETKEMAKTDGSKKKRLTGIPKLDDANKAGTKESQKCTLILTEGDSAKTMAISGISAIKDGRDYYGVFPLRGKLLNVREASVEQIKNNAEINYLKQILGLQSGKEYTDTKDLRYGAVIGMCDSDHDGSHIKGLIMNFFECHYPSLLKIDGFFREFRTPIVKATKAKDEKVFYTLQEYNDWRANPDNKAHTYHIKYYKGLGTSDSKEAKQYFTNIDKNERHYCFDNCAKEAVELAFKKELADKRKEWLKEYDKNNILDSKDKNVKVSDFINRELIHFSNSDNIRSIPRIEDGLKPSQRKIIYATLKKSWKSDIKVSQFAGYISENTAYHHGEASLYQTIVGLAQNYTGSNNINVLEPKGMFGSRVGGGKDSASPRYIFTKPTGYFYDIYHKDDLALYNYLDDDGTPIEPEFYMPVLPMVLVNGTEGIGTGWSTKIPAFNLSTIIANIQTIIDNESTEVVLQDLHPWYRGFNGTFDKVDTAKYLCCGKYTIEKDKVIVSELPISICIDEYKDILDKYLDADKKPANVKGKKDAKAKKETKKKPVKESDFQISYYDNLSTDTHIKFVIHFPKGYLEGLDAKGTEELEKRLCINEVVNISNMHLFNTNGEIQKYSNPNDILAEYAEKRLEYYEKRRNYLLEVLQKDYDLASAKIRFIKEFMAGDLEIYKKKKKDIVKQLIERDYPKFESKVAETDPEEEEDEDKKYSDKGYKYLLGMPIYSLTKEQIEKLKKELDSLEEKINYYKTTNKYKLWSNDLDNLKKFKLW